MITMKGVFFGLAIFFTLLSIFYSIWFSAGMIAILISKKGGTVKGNSIYVFITLASIFWALALS